MYTLTIHNKGGFMETSVVDLRYKMKDVLKALENREKITILYHGKAKEVISPINKEKKKYIKNHVFFGMNRKDVKSVDDEMRTLREGRYNVI